jgi:guanosine-3',5'-bis(diphosphate) 3'-pyrophosphohydrolase
MSVTVDNVRDCYAALGAVHARWNPLPGRFKDYIATPKFNLYQALHTTVIGPNGRPVEIHIRTQEMQVRAEYGVEAHSKYRERVGVASAADNLPQSDDETSWLPRSRNWQSESANAGEFLDNLRSEIGAKEVYVFTPRGKAVGLPAGATAVDFAFALHTEVGNRTMGAKVNGRLVPLESGLNSGDVVEVFTSRNMDAGPSRDWLEFVKSRKAKRDIKRWFAHERRDEYIATGRDLVSKLIEAASPAYLGSLEDLLVPVVMKTHAGSIDGLLAAVGRDQITAQSVADAAIAGPEPITHVTERPARRRQHPVGPGVVVRGAADIRVKLAKCCNPVLDDEITGFVTRSAGVSVHRTDCQNLTALLAEPDRIIEVEWAANSSDVVLVQLQIEGLDRSGLLSDVTRALAEGHVNILSAKVSTSSDRLALIRYVLEMRDTTNLDRLIGTVRRIDSVYDVYRVGASE